MVVAQRRHKKMGGHPARPVCQVSRLVGVMTLARTRPETQYRDSHRLAMLVQRLY